MADATNGGGLESRFSKMEQIQNQMQDALLVQATLQAASDRMTISHTKLLESHGQFVAKHELLMLEFDAKLNALIDIVSRLENGIENR